MGSPLRRRFPWPVLAGLALLLLAGLGFLYAAGHRLSGRTQFAPIAETRDFFQIAVRPEEAFPNRARISLLCLGLDRNWTRKDLPFTKNVRTDTMIALNLDLDHRKACALSVPRDLRVEIPDHGHSRINDAYRYGGIPLTLETVQSFLGITIDYYAIIKLGAVRRLVDAVGGLEIDVEKDMDYDDNWGQLHIHLRQGKQHLNGEQVEGYMRFRHDPEGDFGRMRRQQQVFRTISASLKSPAIVLRFNDLMTLLEENLETNLSRKQLLSLGRIFQDTTPDDLVTATVPAVEAPREGVAYLDVREEPKEALVDWLLRGNAIAEHRLIDVELRNGCRSRAATEKATEILSGDEFPASNRGRADRSDYTTTRIIDHGRHLHAGRRVSESLGVGTLGYEKRKSGPAVTVIIGADFRDRDTSYSAASSPSPPASAVTP